MPDPTKARLRGLVLSATELRMMHPEWNSEMIEDYLSFAENFILLADEIDTKNDIIKETTVITPANSPYTPLATDEEIYIDTDSGDVIVTLPVGIDGTNYRMINIGSSGNKAILIPSGTEDLFGENASEDIYDSEALIMTFETNKGWW